MTRALYQLISDLLANERQRMWRGVTRLLVMSFIAALALGVVLGGIIFTLVGVYQSLATGMAAWQAGLWVGGGLLVLAVVLLAGVRLLGRSKSGRSHREPAAPSTLSAPAGAGAGAGAASTPEVPPGAISAAEQAGGAAARAAQSAAAMVSRSSIGRTDLIVGALVAGLVIGARTGRRR